MLSWSKITYVLFILQNIPYSNCIRSLIFRTPKYCIWASCCINWVLHVYISIFIIQSCKMQQFSAWWLEHLLVHIFIYLNMDQVVYKYKYRSKHGLNGVLRNTLQCGTFTRLALETQELYFWDLEFVREVEHWDSCLFTDYCLHLSRNRFSKGLFGRSEYSTFSVLLCANMFYM